MANAELVVKVSVEKEIHSTLHKALQDIWDTYGVRIDHIDAAWIGIDKVGCADCRLKELSLRTVTRA